MRNLIRVLLFIFGRTGLFLAVVAYVVGQWWIVGITVDLAGIKIDSDVFDNGIMTSISTNGRKNKLETSLGKRRENPSGYFDPGTVQGHNETAGNFAILLQPGVVLFSASGSKGVGGCIRHWLNITFFVALNGILWFVYRKRPEVKACEA